MEPELSCVGALFSPRTAVVDSHGLMEAFLADAEDAGAVVAFKTSVQSGRLLPGGGVEVKTGPEAFTIRADEVVNCAGLAASRVALALGVPPADTPVTYFCKGSYYALHGSRPFSRLIYPVPEKNTSGLGIHATVDLGGQIRFGPDVEWLPSTVQDVDVDEAAFCERLAPSVYAVDTARSSSFYAEVRRYWPALPDDALVADYSGIRPKLVGEGDPAADFKIAEHRRGTDPLSAVSLFGIESPGLTSSMSLADEVFARLNA